MKAMDNLQSILYLNLNLCRNMSQNNGEVETLDHSIDFPTNSELTYTCS